MPYDDFHWIDDRLALGAFVSDSDDLPFDAVLSLETHAPPGIADLVRSGRVDYQWRSIRDGYSDETNDEIVRRFTVAADLIDRWLRDGRTVLVHCMAGVSRSASAVIWYLMRHRGVSWDEAFAQLQARRAKVNPNILFEVPLRIAAGEVPTEAWLEARIAAYMARVHDLLGLDLDPAEIRGHLIEQGTLPAPAGIAG